MELMVAMVLVGVVMLAVATTSIFFIRNVSGNREIHNIYSQINYAFEDLKLRTASASTIDTSDCFNAGEVKQYLTFEGEPDIYVITPNITSNNAQYSYQLTNYVTDPNNTQNWPDFVLMKDGAVAEVLVEGKYHPQVWFSWDQSLNPNVLKVKIQAADERLSAHKVISRSTTLRFWFIDVVR